MRRMLLALAALVAGFAGLALSPADASYTAVTGELVQWEWATVDAGGTYRPTDLVVRDDGWMIVATTSYGDGHLHLVPPWGGVLSEQTRFGPTKLGFRQLELRRGRLYGLRQTTERDEEVHAQAELFELDASTGAIVRPLGRWWFQDLAVDPVTDELLLQTSGDGREPYTHDLVRFDPDRRTTSVVLADTEPRSDRALEVAFSADGQQLYTANVTDVPPTIDVRRRDGTLLHTLQSGQVDSLTAGRPGTCFEGMLLVTRFDGSVAGIRTTPNAQPVPLATGGRAGAVSYAGLDREGFLAAARYDNVTLLACPGFVPPRAPVAPPPPPSSSRAPAGAPAEIAATPPPGNPPPAPVAQVQAQPAPPGPAPAGPPPPPPAPSPVPVAPPGALGPAMQASAAPSAAGADAPDEEHVTSVAASSTPTVALLLGAVVATCMAAYAVGSSTSSTDDLHLQTSRGHRP